MKRHLVGIWQFTGAVLSQFYLIFGGGILPVIYQWASVKIPEFPQLEVRWLPWYYLALFLAATFRAWFVEREEKEKSQRKLDNPVDYELSLTPERVNYEGLKEVEVVTENDREDA